MTFVSHNYVTLSLSPSGIHSTKMAERRCAQCNIISDYFTNNCIKKEIKYRIHRGIGKIAFGRAGEKLQSHCKPAARILTSASDNGIC